jgi:hypothetical protein
VGTSALEKHRTPRASIWYLGLVPYEFFSFAFVFQKKTMASAFFFILLQINNNNKLDLRFGSVKPLWPSKP